MDDIKVNGFFLSEKIAKVRWVPEQYRDSDRFLTGSWDATTNFIKIWRLVGNQYSEDTNECVPKCSAKIPFNGDITGLEFIDSENIAVGCSDGFVSVINIKKGSDIDSLTTLGRSGRLHEFKTKSPAACTSISVHGKDIATVGEDGRLNIVTSNGLKVIKTIDNADSCTITAVSFVNPKEILSANRMGVIKLFDIHSPNNQPSATFYVSCEDDRKSNYVSSLTYHPTQQHIILAGSEEGSITVWDLRQPNFPASYLSAHTSAITEIGFHKTQPSKLFTASENGELWQWTQNSLALSNNVESLSLHSGEAETVNPWLNGERAKNRHSVTSLITGMKKAINSFDANGSKIICGCDSEAVYYIDQII